jgi:hypothetical protein
MSHPSSIARPPVTHDDPWRYSGSIAAHPSNAASFDEPLVAVIARGLAAVAPPWSDEVQPAADGRSHERLLATELYDVWLIHWPAGSGLPAHDHGGSAGAFAMVAGMLDEDVADGTRRRIGVGDVASFGPDHVHAVHNRSDVGATSVHVYSPPLGTMSFVSEPSEAQCRSRDSR